jgi:hypothetical protein
MDGIKVFTTTSSASNRIRNYVYQPILDEEDRLRIDKSTSTLQKQIIKQQNDPSALLKPSTQNEQNASTLDHEWMDIDESENNKSENNKQNSPIPPHKNTTQKSPKTGPSKKTTMKSPKPLPSNQSSILSFLKPGSSKTPQKPVTKNLASDSDDDIQIDEDLTNITAKPVFPTTYNTRRRTARIVDVIGDGNCFYRLYFTAYQVY